MRVLCLRCLKLWHGERVTDRASCPELWWRASSPTELGGLTGQPDAPLRQYRRCGADRPLRQATRGTCWVMQWGPPPP